MPTKLRPRRRNAEPTSRREDSAVPQRLQKTLAAAGLGSRRQCEELILTGRVDVDRQVVTALGAKADPRSQEIRVDGVLLRQSRLKYYAVHKPKGIVSTNWDPAGRPRVVDLLPTGARLFTVGRLDMSSEGLMLATNDGELANRLAHPRYGVEKTYVVEVAGALERGDLQSLRRGVHLAEAFVRPDHLHIRSQHKKSTVIEIVLSEGRNREIRRLLARLGHKVLCLKRIALGPLRLGDLPPGGVRPLRREEIRALEEVAYGPRRKRSRPVVGGVARGHSREDSPRATESPRVRTSDRRSAVAAAKRTQAARGRAKQRRPRGAAQFGTIIGRPRGEQ